jgi:hypothetical protein
LKLLSLRYWALKDGVRYIVPRDSASEKAVNNALLILEHFTDHELSVIMAHQTREENRRREVYERVLRQKRIEIARTFLTNSGNSKRTRTQLAYILGLSMEELMSLMNSAEFLRVSTV